MRQYKTVTEAAAVSLVVILYATHDVYNTGISHATTLPLYFTMPRDQLSETARCQPTITIQITAKHTKLSKSYSPWHYPYFICGQRHTILLSKG